LRGDSKRKPRGTVTQRSQREEPGGHREEKGSRRKKGEADPSATCRKRRGTPVGMTSRFCRRSRGRREEEEEERKRDGNTEFTEGRTQRAQRRERRSGKGASKGRVIRSGWRGFVCPGFGVRRQRAGECRCLGRWRREPRCCPEGLQFVTDRKVCGCKDCRRGDDWGRESHIRFSTFQGR